MFFVLYVCMCKYYLHEDIEGGARGIFERIPHCVADHRCLMNLRPFTT